MIGDRSHTPLPTNCWLISSFVHHRKFPFTHLSASYLGRLLPSFWQFLIKRFLTRNMYKTLVPKGQRVREEEEISGDDRKFLYGSYQALFWHKCVELAKSGGTLQFLCTGSPASTLFSPSFSSLQFHFLSTHLCWFSVGTLVLFRLNLWCVVG